MLTFALCPGLPGLALPQQICVNDGKRFDALDVVVRAGGCDRGGSSREGSGKRSGLTGDLAEDPADDGKRFDALDVG